MMVNTNNYKISGMLIDANSASLGQFHTAVDVDDLQQCQVSFNNDRNLTYTCVYTPTMEGQYKVIVKFAGSEIPKSPFSVGIEGAAGDATKCRAYGPGVEKTGVMVETKTYFEVSTKGKIRVLDFKLRKMVLVYSSWTMHSEACIVLFSCYKLTMI